MNDSEIFFGRELFIATKHRKEEVIAPLMKRSFQIQCKVHPALDTDVFGTFSGERKRLDDALTTLRKKCELAFDISNEDLVMASEGSFGPHPEFFFVPINEEILLLIDRKNDLEFVVKEITTETNFAATSVKSWEELKAFAENAKFPEHALILRNSENDFTVIRKGINLWEDLELEFNRFIQKFPTVFVETDMRAQYNPTRMKAIERCTEKMIELMNSKCPACATPGFKITQAKSGLPCIQCGFPTRSVKSYIYSCNRCMHEKEELFPKGKMNEDPMYCDHCNP